jgi:type IV pilus assembly protein PilY1
MKRLLGFLLCLAAIPLGAGPLQADDSDIFGANIKPNVMILVDTSGSMQYFVPGGGIVTAYSPSTNYNSSASLDPRYYNQFTATYVYKAAADDLSSSVYKTAVTSITGTNSAAAQTALNTYGFYNGSVAGAQVQLRMGRYIQYMHSLSYGDKAKIDVAKDVIKTVIQGTKGVRFGIAMFKNSKTANYDNSVGGATILAEIGSLPDNPTDAQISTPISSLVANGSTPLGGALSDVGQYYAGNLIKSGSTKYASPIQSTCQPNFIIAISDGQPNDGKYSWAPFNNTIGPDSSTTGVAPVVSPWAANRLKTQGIILHTVGFSVDDPSVTNATLTTLATITSGQFYSSSDEASLSNSLQDAIRRIMQATFCFAAPVLPTTSATGVNRAYLASFESDPFRPFWKGHLKAYTRVNGLVQVDSNMKPLDTNLVWDAGVKLNSISASSRTIYTIVGGALTTFNNTNVTAALLGVADNTARDKVINFVRGVDTEDENANGNTSEDRSWKLGDIFHSTPVLVTPPFLPSADSTYTAFRTAQKDRKTILLAGANDGMLHAFQESDGTELWAFIPPNLLNKLYVLRDSSKDHPFLLDGSPIVADVKIKLSGDSAAKWRTVVIFGERRGGNAYYCLDITDTTSPQYLWEFTDSEIAETWSDPIIGPVVMASSTNSPVNSYTGKPELYLAFVGGGHSLNAGNTAGRGVFAINIATGYKIWEYKTKTTGTYTPACSATSPPTDDKECMNFSIPSSPLALALNKYGYIDHLYIGDVAGQVWKFLTKDKNGTGATLSGTTTGTINNWGDASDKPGKRFFVAPSGLVNPPAAGEFMPGQAIYYPPTAAYDDANTLWLYFGTGDRYHPNADASNRLYAVKDPSPDDLTNKTPIFESAPSGYSSLTDVTTTNGTAINGWYVKLQNADEKVLAQALVFNKIVYYNTFVPTTSEACDTGGGDSEQYAVQMATGYAAYSAWSATPGVAATTYGAASSSASNKRYTGIGVGIASRPMVVMTDSGTTLTSTVIQGTTDQQLPQNTVPPPSTMRRILYWKENY